MWTVNGTRWLRICDARRPPESVLLWFLPRICHVEWSLLTSPAAVFAVRAVEVFLGPVVSGRCWPVARRSSANTHTLSAAINVSPQVPAMTSRVPAVTSQVHAVTSLVPAMTSQVPDVTSPAAVRRHFAHISRLYCGLMTSQTGKHSSINTSTRAGQKRRRRKWSDPSTLSNDEEPTESRRLYCVAAERSRLLP